MSNALSNMVFKVLFGKGCFAIFVGKNIVGAMLCAYTATSMRELAVKLLPWVGAIFLDLVWLGIPTFICFAKDVSARAGFHLYSTQASGNDAAQFIHINV